MFPSPCWPWQALQASRLKPASPCVMAADASDVVGTGVGIAVGAGDGVEVGAGLEVGGTSVGDGDGVEGCVSGRGVQAANRRNPMSHAAIWIFGFVSCIVRFPVDG